VREVDRVPQLTAGWEDKASELTPQEGFLVSRIDGVTSWHSLRAIAGMPPDRVDDCLERWLRDGLIQLAAERKVATAAPVALTPDASLELPIEIQRRAIEVEALLDGTYHELLGVTRDADSREIKRSYFKLSRDFHPDRYFGKNVGAFGDLLDRIFKQIAIAYELLMDPMTRAELERSMSSAPEPAPEPVEAPAASGEPQKFTKRQWLARMRKQFKLPEELVTERRYRARQLAESARVSAHESNWTEAASCIRLAIAFDPWEDDYKHQFSGIQVEVNRIRAEELLERASGAWDSHSQAQALKLYEEVLHYRPADANATDKAAQLCLELEDFDRAIEYADIACELAPQVAEYQHTRGRILRRSGRRERAVEALTTAQKLDPQNIKAADELKKLRQAPQRVRGGTQ
jgi:tetratricopeptide (TPR) repeat protein